MKKTFLWLLLPLSVILGTVNSFAQCSICTKTAQQLGDGPATGLNSGIIYLGLLPMLIVGYIGFRWWKNEKAQQQHKQ